MRDELLTRHVAEQLDVPPVEPEFFEEVWEAIHSDQRFAVRRWRRAAVALALIALVGVGSATAVLTRPRGATAKTLEGTVSCAAQLQAGLHLIEVWGAVNGAPRGPGYVTLFTTRQIVAGQYPPQFNLGAADRTVSVDRRACRPSRLAVPLAPRPLTSNGVITPSFLGGFSDICQVHAARVVIHYRVVVGAHGATSAQVAVRADDARRTPIAYIDWRPTRMPYFLADSCNSK